MTLGMFGEIGLLIGIATLVAFVMRLLRQPLIIGHIITGFLVAQLAMGIFQNMDTLELFSQLGISFLLFSVGLTLNPRVFRDYGLVSLITGTGQVALTGAAGFALCMLLGYGVVPSIYVGIALAFSSTVIVMKLLADKGDLDKLYVKLSIGSLILQDFFAIILLFAIPFFANAQGNIVDLGRTLLTGIAVGALVFLFSHYVIRHLHRYLTRSQELLFLFATSWGIGVSALFAAAGFSLEGGALIAGIALSTVPSRHEIAARLAPLRDFFIVAFFILLGTHMVVSDFSSILVPAAILSVFVLVGNPLLQLIIMGLMGYRRKTSFQTGMMAAQISEFSLILVSLGVTLGHVAPEALSTVTLVGLVTIFISSYLILYSDRIYRYVAPYLTIFERRHTVEHSIRTKSTDAILIGGGRIGFDFIELFKEEKISYTVLDHDPEVIGRLAQERVPHIYGDASDPDLLDDLRIKDKEMVISTIPELETNLVILSCAKRSESSPVVIVAAHKIPDALDLYAAGADYVVLPHFLGGSYAASLVRRFTHDAADLQGMRSRHIAKLRERSDRGDEHPQFDWIR